MSERWDVSRLAGPYLDQLAAQTGSGVFLAVLEGDHVMSVDQRSGGDGLLVIPELGSHALQRVQRSGLHAYTPHTITDTGRLLHELEIVRRRGCAIEDGEYKIGLRSVAAPVYDRTGQVRYALGAVGLFRRVSSDEFSHAVEQTVAFARRLSQALGAQG